MTLKRVATGKNTKINLCKNFFVLRTILLLSNRKGELKS